MKKDGSDDQKIRRSDNGCRSSSVEAFVVLRRLLGIPFPRINVHSRMKKDGSDDQKIRRSDNGCGSSSVEAFVVLSKELGIPFPYIPVHSRLKKETPRCYSAR